MFSCGVSWRKCSFSCLFFANSLTSQVMAGSTLSSLHSIMSGRFTCVPSKSPEKLHAHIPTHLRGPLEASPRFSFACSDITLRCVICKPTKTALTRVGAQLLCLTHILQSTQSSGRTVQQHYVLLIGPIRRWDHMNGSETWASFIFSLCPAAPVITQTNHQFGSSSTRPGMPPNAESSRKEKKNILLYTWQTMIWRVCLQNIFRPQPCLPKHDTHRCQGLFPLQFNSADTLSDGHLMLLWGVNPWKTVEAFTCMINWNCLLLIRWKAWTKHLSSVLVSCRSRCKSRASFKFWHRTHIFGGLSFHFLTCIIKLA